MKKFYPTSFNGAKLILSSFKIFITVFLMIASTSLNAQCPPGVQCDFLKKVGNLASNNGAEISSFDHGSKRVYTVAGPVIEYHTMDNSGALTFGGTLPLGFTLASGQAAFPNSVAIHGGILAASYAITVQEGSPAGIVHLNGRVSFYNAATGTILNVVTVGALPDMVVFTPDGKKALTANEGEPSSYGRLTSVDPEGSVSIIDLSNGVGSATVQTVNFQSFIGQEAALRAQGIRIYGPGANAAQDFEPEYIAISPDGTQAWVTLQENNAIAIVNIASATVTSIKPLGLKDHSKPTVLGLQTFQFPEMPSIGTTTGGQVMKLGGFSGLTFDGYAPNGNMKFITHTDRGPNGEPTGQIRPFALPNFAPEIVKFEVNRSTGQVTLMDRIQLKRSNGQLLTGLPNINIPAATELTPYHDETGVDLFGNPTGIDILGGDFEGIVKAQDGSFWMVDEYRIALYHFDAMGVLIKRYVPAGTAAAAGMAIGTYGEEKLPAVLAQRRQNRGFEGMAFQDGKLYLFVQSPLRNPSSSSNAMLNAWKYTRVVEFNPTTETTTGQYIYIMDNNAPAGGATDTRADKIGDAVAIGNGEFLVLERDDDASDSDPISDIQKKIYRFSIGDATNVNALNNVINGKTIEQMTLAELAAANIKPIVKYLHVDLATNYNMTEKLEGLAMVDCNTLALINDNDFGVGGLTYGAGIFNGYPNSNSEKPLLGLLNLRNNGLDASDRDNKIAIKHSPIFGMFEPDAIASFVANGETYYITANEGDARADWPGYSEEIRVGASGYTLDAAIFPNASVLKDNANLGRLQLTNATGNTDADVAFEQIHAMGARSFSIWNSNGQLVFDSGDEIEQLTAALSAASFNSDGTAATFDTRSDNKGPEIEAVTIGVIGGTPYAFVGSERTGDIFVYDVSNPMKPVFKQYINTPEDLGVEGLAFVSAANSPTGRPLVISSAEVSKTVTVYEINAPVCSITAIPSNNTYTGGVQTNIYLGYGPQSLTLSVGAQSTAGAPYSYSWTGEGLSSYNTANPVFAPQKPGSYTFNVTVTSQCGISTTCSITICVTDVRVEGHSGKVYVCHAPSGKASKSQAIAVSVNAVAAHLLNHPGDKLGKCDEEPCQDPRITRLSTNVIDEEVYSGMQVTSFPNPTSTYFTLQVRSDKNEVVEIRVRDIHGRMVYSVRGAQGTYTFGEKFTSGIYVAEITQGDQRQTAKLVKQ